ncbi:hypothetical protein SEA_CRICKO_37 [Streptomyces phage CricKo]|jgi:hypothetical protein|nr:hypothetical protein SEA_SENDITCS_35 [Streptomyces phage SendItCS]QJD49920.1 hypothetical protein SEA_CRICKO_37 [Streptomyces phage CricKo]QNL30652.1 hypothetical protein SEA_THIQQUMS_37 [Streptomyces phage Thiqqums]WIC89373.1 membrane protein [Streptomyces phage Miek]
MKKLWIEKPLVFVAVIGAAGGVVGAILGELQIRKMRAEIRRNK